MHSRKTERAIDELIATVQTANQGKGAMKTDVETVVRQIEEGARFLSALMTEQGEYARAADALNGANRIVRAVDRSNCGESASSYYANQRDDLSAEQHPMHPHVPVGHVQIGHEFPERLRSVESDPPPYGELVLFRRRGGNYFRGFVTGETPGQPSVVRILDSELYAANDLEWLPDHSTTRYSSPASS